MGLPARPVPYNEAHSASGPVHGAAEPESQASARGSQGVLLGLWLQVGHRPEAPGPQKAGVKALSTVTGRDATVSDDICIKTRR